MSITLKRLNQIKVPFVGICLGVADMLGIKSFLGFFLNAAVTKHEPTMGFPPPIFTYGMTPSSCLFDLRAEYTRK